MRPPPSAEPSITISNVFGSFNRGDALLVETLHDAIRQAFGPDASLSGIAHFPDLERVHLPDVAWHRPPGRSYETRGWRRKLENISRTLGALAFIAAGAPRTWPAIPPRDQQSGIRAIKDAELVVSCAGGFLIDTNLSILGNLLQIATAHRFGTPVVIAPQTIGPIRRRWIRPIAKWALSRCLIVCAREGYSLEFLRELGVPEGRLRRLTDLALEHDRVDLEAGTAALASLGVDDGERLLGASVVNWSFPRSTDATGARQRYFESFCEVIGTIHKTLGMRTLLVNQVSSDLPLARRVKDRLGDAVILDEADRTPAEMRGLIRRSSAFFGSRFHSCVFALLERVPTFSLAYSYKSTGIMEDLGLSDYVTDIDGFDARAVSEILSRMIAEPDQVRALIETGLRNQTYPSFADILTEAKASLDWT